MKRRVPWLGGWAVGSAFACCVASGNGQAQMLGGDNAIAAFRAWAQRVEDCFVRELERMGPDESRSPSSVGSFGRTFLFEHIAQATTAAMAQQRPLEALAASSPEEYCRQKAVPDYLVAYRKAHMDAAQALRGSLAGLGTARIESSSTFVSFGQNYFGVHASGHYDITLQSIRQFDPQRQFSREAAELLARGSQMPDLFRWKHESIHAHTPESKPETPRESRIAAGQAHFLATFSSWMKALEVRATVGDDAEAIFILGVLSHMVQDLVYHRGMTLRQHAGLAYVLDRNPDFPKEPTATKRREEAVLATHRAFALAVKRVGLKAWQRLAEWSAPGTFSFSTTARNVFQTPEDNGVWPLLEYFLLIGPYVSDAQRRDGLRDESCTTDLGVTCWSANDLLERLGE